MKRLGYALAATSIYLLVSNLGNLFFGIARTFSWTTTLWESFFFFMFIYLLLNYKKK